MKEYQIETIMKWTKIIQSLFAAGMNNQHQHQHQHFPSDPNPPSGPLPVPLTELMLATVSYS